MTVLGCLAAGPASAELGDPPVWNLWSGQQTIGTNIGDGARATLCGAADCGGDQSINFPGNEPNPSPLNKGVAIFEVDTVGPLRADGTPFFNSAGSGHINPFLRFQHTENQAVQPYGGQGSHPSGGVEAAYNTDDRSWPNTRTLQGDAEFVNQAKDHNAFNHSVRIGDLVQFNQDGVEDAAGGYFGFWLDINEPGTDDKRTLLLDELEFFVSDRADLNKYVPQLNPDPNGNPGAEPDAGTLARVDFDAQGNEQLVLGSEADKIWDLDFDNYDMTSAGATTNNQERSICAPKAAANDRTEGCGAVLLDSLQGSAGSGDFDMRVMLSVDLFRDVSTGALLQNHYVYLYNFMGSVDSRVDEATAGFEEWATVTDIAPPPPDGEVSAPLTATLTGIGLLGFAFRRRMPA